MVLSDVSQAPVGSGWLLNQAAPFAAFDRAAIRRPLLQQLTEPRCPFIGEPVEGGGSNQGAGSPTISKAAAAGGRGGRLWLTAVAGARDGGGLAAPPRRVRREHGPKNKPAGSTTPNRGPHAVPKADFSVFAR